MKKICTLIALGVSLQGCFFVGAAAGAAAIAAVYDHRKLEHIATDQHLTKIVYEKVHGDADLRERSHVEITSFNQVILLTGETPNPAWRARAEELAKSVPGVNRVYNQITIEGPTSSLTRTSDSWITTKIKSEMLATKGLKSSTIKVSTEDGVVYLMGIVSREQAGAAVEIARQVSGVRKVVKIFKYTGEADAQPQLVNATTEQPTATQTTTMADQQPVNAPQAANTSAATETNSQTWVPM